MITRECEVQDPLGLHARLATQIAEIVGHLQASVTLSFGGLDASATDTMALMRLDVREGERVLITATGPDEQEAAATIEHLLKS